MKFCRILPLLPGLLTACVSTGDVVEGDTTASNLVPVFEEFIKSDYATLILTAPDTTQFIQFSGGRGGVQMDFPLVTAEQQAYEPKMLEFFEARSLNVVENRGSDGSRFMDVELPADPVELADVTKSAFREVFGIAGDAKLKVWGEGFSWPPQ